MYLSDNEIRARLEQLNFATDADNPFDPDLQIGPCSIDLRLSEVVWRPARLPRLQTIDLTKTKLLELNPRRNWKQTRLARGETVLLRPGELVLGRVYEEFSVPPDCVGFIEGRSSFARMGLLVHSTGSVINPGWRGHMPLTIVNNSPFPLRLPPLLSLCQLLLAPLASTPKRLYGADTLRDKYMDDDGGPSYWWRDQTVKNLLSSLGEPDVRTDMQDRLLERVGVPPDEVLARLDHMISSKPAGTYGNVDDLVEEFTRLEDRKRMLDSILRGAAKGAVPVLLGASIASFWIHPIGFLHIVIWVLAVLSVPIAVVAHVSAPQHYLGKRELAQVPQAQPS